MSKPARRRDPGKVISTGKSPSLLPSKNDSMKTLPKVDKKISQRVMKHEVGENYIKDKLKMAEETLVRMEKSKVLWGELIRFFDKMHQGFKIVAASATGADETLSALSKLYSGELHDTLVDISTTRSKISAQYQICANAIFNSFVLDVAYTMEPHLKQLAVKTKEVNSQGTILRNQYASAEKTFMKVKDKNPHITQLQLQDHMKKFTDFKTENDKGKANVLQGVLLMEKERLTYLISAFSRVVCEEMALGDMMMSQATKIENWKSFTDSKHTLTGLQAESIAVTRTTRPVSTLNLLRTQSETPLTMSSKDDSEPSFGERNTSKKNNNNNNNNSDDGVKKAQTMPAFSKSTGWARASLLVAQSSSPRGKEKETYDQQSEIILTCEEILADMKSKAEALEDHLKLLDGLVSNDLIDMINQVLATDDLKKAENLIWEYEDYTSDYPAVFQERKYFAKKQFFKQRVAVMKERLNQLLEEELQIMQEEYALEIGLDKRGRGDSWYNSDASFTLDALDDNDASDFDFT